MRSKIIKTLSIFSILFICLILLLYLILNTEYSKNFVVSSIENIVSSATKQTFRIGELDGNLISFIKLKDVELVVDDETFLKIDEISTHYSLPLLASVISRGDIPLKNPKINGLTLNFIKDKDGIWTWDKIGDRKNRKKNKKKKNDDRSKKKFDLFLANAYVTNSNVKFVNLSKNDTKEFVIHPSTFSIDLLGIYKKFTLKGNNMNFDFLPINMKVRSLSTEALITKSNVAFKNLSAVLNGINIQGQGVVNDYKKPQFNVSAYINDFKPKGIGIFNIFVDTNGKFYSRENIVGKAEVNFINSTIKDKRFWTSFKEVELKGTKAFIEGDINAEFGRTYVDGYLDLRRLLTKNGKNSFNFNTHINKLFLKEFLQSLKLTPKSFDFNEKTTINSYLVAEGSWSGKKDFISNLDISELNVSADDFGKITSKGNSSFNLSSINIDLDNSSSDLKLSNIFEDFNKNIILNGDFKLNGNVPFKGKILTNSNLSIDANLSNSIFSGLKIISGNIVGSYINQIFTFNNFDITSPTFNLVVQGNESKNDGFNINYKIKSDDISFVHELNNKYPVNGQINGSGTLVGKIDNPKITFKGLATNFTYKDYFRFKSGDIDLNTNLSKENKGILLKANLSNLKIKNKNFNNLNITSKPIDGVNQVTLNSKVTKNFDIESNFTTDSVFNYEKIFNINKLNLSFNGSKFQLKNPSELKISSKNIKFNSFELENNNGNIAINGQYSFNGSNSIESKFNNLENKIISNLFNIDSDFDGNFTGDLKLYGNTQNPVFKINLSSTNPSLYTYRADELMLDISGKNNVLNINIDSKDYESSYLKVNGKINSNLNLANLGKNLKTGKINFKVDSNNFNLGFLSLLRKDIKTLEAYLDTNITISNTLANPKIDGQIHIGKNSFKISPIENTFEFEPTTINFNKNTAKVSKAVLKSKSGSAQLAGSLDLNNMQYDLNADLNNIFIKLRGFEADFEGNINLNRHHGKIDIKGDLISNNTKINIKGPKSKKVEDIKFVDNNSEENEYIVLSNKDEKSFYEKNVALDLDIKIPNNSWVKGKGVNAEIFGDLKIEKVYDRKHIISGTIETIRGQYTAFGRLFKVETGTLNFPSTSDLNPLLDINASYSISDKRILIALTGKAENPKLNLSSSPPMPETDIISYLVFGTSRDNLGTNQRDVASELASNLAIGEIAEIIGSKFGLDVLTVQGEKKVVYQTLK